MKTPCEECHGKGQLYLRIGSDVHIAKCSACDGWGSYERVLTIAPIRNRKTFGAVNLDEVTNED